MGERHKTSYHHHWAVVVYRGWAKASSCHLQVSLYCAVLCQIVSLSHGICPGCLSTAWLVSLVVFSWSPNGDTRGPSVFFDIPWPGPLHFSHIAYYIYDFCPLPDTDVGISILVGPLRDVEQLFHFGMCGYKFVLCLFGQCPGLCTIWHSWQHTGVVHLSLQADGKTTSIIVFNAEERGSIR